MSLYSIKTSDAKSFLNRWVAVLSVVFTFVLLSLTFWELLIHNKQVADPVISNLGRSDEDNNVNDTAEVLQDFYYFDGIGITNPSTNFSDVTNATTIANRCKLFGSKCLGFDTNGSLFLERDKDIATLKGFLPKYRGGLYIGTTSKHAKRVCDNLGGDFNDTTRSCDNFNRTAIDEYPFPI